LDFGRVCLAPLATKKADLSGPPFTPALSFLNIGAGFVEIARLGIALMNSWAPYPQE
jgi:hypothetical protein